MARRRESPAGSARAHADPPLAVATGHLAAALRAEVISAFACVTVDVRVRRERGLPFWIVVRVLRGGYTVQAGAGRPRSIAVGEVLVIPPGLPHAIDHRRVLADALHVRFAGAGGGDPLGRPVGITVVSAKQAGALAAATSLVAQLTAVPATPETWRTALRRHRAGLDLLDALAAQVADAAPPPDAARQRLAPVLERLAAADHRRVGRDEIAHWMGLPPSSAARVFRAAIGESPARHARRLRMQRAGDLLAGSTLKIREVAERLGFSDEFAFSRQFRRDLGTSPAEFRRSARL